MSDEYEFELTGSRDDVAAVLRGVADGVATGSVRLGDGDDAVVVDPPEELTLEIELEAEDDELELELELEWPNPDGGVDPSGVDTATDESVENAPPDDVSAEDDSAEDALESNVSVEDAGSSALAGSATPTESLARFEVFRDRSDEWRWRLVHRNGNVIATSGEGYTRKHNARKGLRSVVENAPDAEIGEDPDG